MFRDVNHLCGFHYLDVLVDIICRDTLICQRKFVISINREYHYHDVLVLSFI
jgi:hypothetical protein